MSSWRDDILNNFVPNVAKLTLVSDPDSLLTEEKLALELSRRGFDLIEFDDSVEFRHVYESKYRSSHNHVDPALVVRSREPELESLPYDLLQAERKLRFNLGDLFPNLSYPVVEKLDRGLLDALFDALSKSPPGRMGDDATKDFILRHVFGIDAELIISEADILRTLLRLHYNKSDIPQVLSDRLARALRRDGFQDWPLDEIAADGEAFFSFLQERWPAFLKRNGGADGVGMDSSEYGLKYSGPVFLPFDHKDVRVYIDNLFLEGKLHPVRVPDLVARNNSWIRVGIVETVSDDEARVDRLFELIEKDRATTESKYSEWIAFAMKWAELSALVHCSIKKERRSQLRKLGDALNIDFAKWLRERYGSLINLSPTNPVMPHHVPRRLARDMEASPDKRVALVVIDGLALDQWVAVRQILHKRDINLIMRESAIFAWIPTLTSISRQSLFSGKLPLYFPASINSTNKEKSFWEQFWENNGFSKLDVVYKRGLGDGDAVRELKKLIHPDKTKAVGLVVDKVDKIMHGMRLGAAGMHNQIKQWCDEGFLGSLIGCLLDYGYDVWMTSDHGNIECKGGGRPSDGVIAGIRGERVRVYPTRELCSKTASGFSFAGEWRPVGLPPDYFPLVAGGGSAFANPGDRIVGHGGISIEEVIAPLVKFERRKR